MLLYLRLNCYKKIIIYDYLREIKAFNIEKYYEIDAYFKDFEAKLETYKNKKIEISTEEEANKIIKDLEENTEVPEEAEDKE